MSDERMKPILILPPSEMSAEDMKLLRENGICVVEAKNPALVKFLDPIPSAAERTRTEDAAIELSRKILSREYWQSEETRGELARTYIDLLVKGTRLDPRPTKAEREQQIFDREKEDELRRLAREEAKAERLAMKAATQKAQKNQPPNPSEEK